MGRYGLSNENRRSTSERRPYTIKTYQQSVDGALIGTPQLFNLVLQLQLSSLERGQLKVVRAKMGHFVLDLAL